MTSLSTGTRREQNKQATRQAIVDALASLLQEEPGSKVTATQIAEAAGISRRTLFNYFPTVDAVFSYPLHEVLNRMVQAITELTDTMPLINAIVYALRSDDIAGILGRVALFGAHLKDDAPGCYPQNSAEWHSATKEVITKLAARYPQADVFSIRVFTHALVGAGQAAFDEWIERLPGPGSTGPEITDDLVNEFRTLIARAMETLNEGFSALPLTSAQPSKEN